MSWAHISSRALHYSISLPICPWLLTLPSLISVQPIGISFWPELSSYNVCSFQQYVKFLIRQQNTLIFLLTKGFFVIMLYVLSPHILASITLFNVTSHVYTLMTGLTFSSFMIKMNALVSISRYNLSINILIPILDVFSQQILIFTLISISGKICEIENSCIFVARTCPAKLVCALHWTMLLIWSVRNVKLLN